MLRIASSGIVSSTFRRKHLNPPVGSITGIVKLHTLAGDLPAPNVWVTTDTGVRARGLTLATAPGAEIVAPTAGRVIYAGRFRRYGNIVIVDHGSGWTSLIAGLDAVGAWPPLRESHVEMDGAWALYEAWVRLQHGDIDTALVFAFGKSSVVVEVSEPEPDATAVCVDTRPIGKCWLNAGGE